MWQRIHFTKNNIKWSLIIVGGIVIAFCIMVIVYSAYNNYIITQSLTKNDGDYVVLVHGLARTSLSMQIMGVHLAKQGYKVINITYPSTNDTIEQLTIQYLKPEIEKAYQDKTKKINMVTHSMGAILVRYLLSIEPIEQLDKVVMIAPPNRGSVLADELIQGREKYVEGFALPQLSTSEHSFVNTLPQPDYTVGVIAGKYDKKVSVDRTTLDTMTAFIIVPRHHTWIVNAKEVIDATIQFLDHGTFSSQ